MLTINRTLRTGLIEAYGMTEVAHQMCSNPMPLTVRVPGSVGLPAGPEVRLTNSEGNEIAPGEVWELVIRGNNVTPRYLNLADDKQERLNGGWFRTGNLRIRITALRKEMLLKSLETRLSSLPKEQIDAFRSKGGLGSKQEN